MSRGSTPGESLSEFGAKLEQQRSQRPNTTSAPGSLRRASEKRRGCHHWGGDSLALEGQTMRDRPDSPHSLLFSTGITRADEDSNQNPWFFHPRALNRRRGCSHSVEPDAPST